MEKNYFKELSQIDVSQHVEKKGKFSYLSWAWAVQQLREVDPTATWETVRFDGMPYMKTECGYFVEVAVTVQGITLSQIHPVLDNYNKPIAQPNAFQINTSIQRCLVKAIALHGLGLYIYAGEDLPPEDKAETEKRKAEEEKERMEKVAYISSLRESNEVLATFIGELEAKASKKVSDMPLAFIKKMYMLVEKKVEEIEAV